MRPLLPLPAILLLLLLAMTGCRKPQPSLVGTWHSGMGGALTTYHFRPDATFAMDTLLDANIIHVEGHYEVGGNSQLHLDPTRVDTQGPQATQLKATAQQASRVTLQFYSPASFRLGKDEPPLIVTKSSPVP